MLSRLNNVLKNLAENFVQFTADVLYDRRQETSLIRAYTVFLKVLSCVFAQLVRLRFFLYDNRILRDTPLGCKVVVIGNLTMGGTGKTPVAEKMARVLSKRGRKIAILSRGYKSKKVPFYKKFWCWLTQGKLPEPRVVSDGCHLLLDSDEAGDEPYMLARNLLPLGVVVIVHKNRVEAGSFALKKFQVDTILLDDGMQYLPLRGQINLLLIDKTNPFGNRNLLPRGILREPVKNVRRGTYVFLTKSDGKPAPELIATIRGHSPDVEIIECAHKPKLLSSLDGRETLPLEYLKDRAVATFSGIATPEKFEDFVRNFGGKIRYNKRFLDHHRFSEDDLEDIFEVAKTRDVEFVVTTEKDAVRIDTAKKWHLPLYYLRMEIEILSGRQSFQNAVARICADR